MSNETSDISALPAISETKVNDNQSKSLNEKIVYRTQSRLPGLLESNVDKESYVDHTECPRCHSVISIRPKHNKSPKGNERLSKISRSRSSVSAMSHLSKNCEECGDAKKQLNRSPSPSKKHSNRSRTSNMFKSHDPNLDWKDLGDKIEGWFDSAKTPGIF